MGLVGLTVLNNTFSSFVDTSVAFTVVVAVAFAVQHSCTEADKVGGAVAVQHSCAEADTVAVASTEVVAVRVGSGVTVDENNAAGGRFVLTSLE